MAKVTIDTSSFLNRNGYKAEVWELKDVLEYSKCLKSDNGKGKNGLICAYDTGVLGDYSSTDGVIFIDIDKVPRQIVDLIMNEDKFEELSSFCNPLLAIQPSASYNDKKKDKCGLHIFFKTLPIKGDDVANNYKEWAVNSLALICECVKKLFNFDLDEYIDAHNTNIKQKFFLSRCDYRYNEKAVVFTENTLTKDTWKKLKEKHQDIFKELRFLNNKNTNNTNNTNNSVKAVNTGDANIKFIFVKKDSYPKYEDRYPITNLLAFIGCSEQYVVDVQCYLRELYGGKVDGKFKSDIKKSYYTAINVRVPNFTERDVIIGRAKASEWGVIVTFGNENIKPIEIPENKYLSHYNDLIINIFEKYSRILIQAPTGTGKTTLMIEFAKKYNAVILVPFNSMLSLYCEKEDEFGRMIPTGILAVGTGDGKHEYTEDSPVCMVWDQAVKYDLSNRLVISDETHQWFFDRTYRQSAIKTINQAKKWNKIICISATPAGEEEELNLYRLKFAKKRDIIRTSFVISKNSGGFIKGLLNGRELNLNYIVFSDRHAMKLYQNFPEGCLLHSEKRNTQEFKDVIQKERLSNSITFCTALAYNGLNFGNKGNYKVIIDVKEGEDTANRIIQAVGRLRNANITEVVVVFTKRNEDSSKRSVGEKVIDNNILKEFVERNNGKSIVDFDERYTEQDSIEALTTIEKYLISHSSKENIISDLINEGYFSIQEYYDAEKHEKLELVEKKESNKKLKEIILNSNGCIDEIKAEELNDYQKKWIKRMNKINALVNVDWVRFINGRKMDSLLETLFEEVRLIYEVCRLTNEEFEFYYSDDKLNEISNLKDSNGSKISDVGYKIVKNRFLLARKIRKMYELVDTYEVDPMEKVLDEFMGIKEDSRIKSIQLKSEGGKKGGKKGKSITIEDSKGKVLQFDTIKDAANKFDLSVPTMRSYIEQGKFELVIKHKKHVYRIINQ
jgi:hypothetical protein